MQPGLPLYAWHGERGQVKLGQPLADLFASFEPVPVAAASLAQVHRAVLLDGTAVAVKVQRPDLARLVNRDLDALRLGLRIAYWLAPWRMQRTNLRDFFAEFRRYTLQELDFLQEAHVIGRFQANFAGRVDVKFPTVFPSHGSRRVLTLGWVKGLRLREAAGSLEPARKQKLVVLLVDVLLQMFVSDGLFHADLHPGNIFFHEDGTFTLPFITSRRKRAGCRKRTRRHSSRASRSSPKSSTPRASARRVSPGCTLR